MRFLFVFSILFLFHGYLFAEIDPSTFLKSFYFYSANPLRNLPEQTVIDHQNTVIVFVTGLGGSRMPDVFREAAKVVGGEGERAYFIRPNDFNPLAKNADYIEQELLRVIKKLKPQQKILLVSSCRGGLESWGLLKSNPELLRNRLLAAIFVSTPFFGTPFADLMRSENPNALLPAPTRFLEGYGRRKAIEQFTTPAMVTGFLGVTVSVATRFTEQTLAEAPNSDALPDEKFLYIATTTKSLPFHLKYIPGVAQKMHVCGRILSYLTEDEHDGIAPLASQIPPGDESRAVKLFNTHHLELLQTKQGQALIKAALTSNY